MYFMLLLHLLIVCLVRSRCIDAWSCDCNNCITTSLDGLGGFVAPKYYCPANQVVVINSMTVAADGTTVTVDVFENDSDKDSTFHKDSVSCLTSSSVETVFNVARVKIFCAWAFGCIVKYHVNATCVSSGRYPPCTDSSVCGNTGHVNIGNSWWCCPSGGKLEAPNGIFYCTDPQTCRPSSAPSTATPTTAVVSSSSPTTISVLPSSPTSNANNAAAIDPSSSSSSEKAAIIAGSVIGGIGIVVLVAVLYLRCRSSQNSKKSTATTNVPATVSVVMSNEVRPSVTIMKHQHHSNPLSNGK